MGFRPITWYREAERGHYFIDVRRDGSAHAAYLSGSVHTAIGEGHEDLGTAILACTEHERALPAQAPATKPAKAG